MFHPPALASVSGQRVANISFNGMPARMMPAIVKDYLKHHQPPRKMFIEVSCIGRVNEPGSLERFTVLMPRSADVNDVIEQSNSKIWWATQVSHLYRFNSELMWRSLLFWNRSDQDWIMNSVVSEQWLDSCSEDQIREFRFSSQDAVAIGELASIAESTGSEVELVLAPYLPSYKARTVSCDRWLREIESSLGRRVSDYSLAIEDTECFADPIHLNERGAALFAKMLLEASE